MQHKKESGSILEFNKVNTNNMKKKIQVLVFSLFISTIGFSQNCYSVLANLNGMDISAYQGELNAKSCELKDSFHQDFRSEFGVFDFGYYQISRTFQGGFDQVWDKVIADANASKRYNVIFGRETTSEGGVDVNQRVKLNLPSTGDMTCMSQEMLESITQEMKIILNEKNKPYHTKQIRALQVLSEFIIGARNCCAGGNRSGSRVVTDIDTSKLKIQLCIDNCSNNYSPQNSVALILNNKMPDILFKIYYPNSSNMCFDVDAVVTINYKKTTNVTSRNRDDEFITVARSKLGNSVYCSWGTQTVHDKKWPTNQGGRVKIELKDILGNVLKTFHFTIKAQNPKIGEVLLFLDQAPYDKAWMMKKIGMHESGTAVDASAEMLQFNQYNSSLESLQTDWNHSSRCPNFSINGDGGIGIFQLTDYPIPHTQELWDWKCNAYGAYKKLTHQDLKNRVRDQFNVYFWEHPTNPDFDHMVTKWDKANPTKKVDKLTNTNAGFTWKFGPSQFFGNGNTKINDYFNENISNGEKSVLDAWITKLYNCWLCTAFLTASQAPPIGPVDQKPVWQLNWNNYLNDVFNQQIPTYK